MKINSQDHVYFWQSQTACYTGLPS